MILAAAAAIGLVLGLLGGGGSILAVPALVYLAGLDPKVAIATSLIVVGTTAGVAVVPHARAGNVAWRIGLVFAVSAMAGAFAGGAAAAYIPAKALLLLFAVMMVVTAGAMLRGRGELEPTAKELPVLKVLVEGLAVGGLTGLVGAGGGFLVVPALVLLGGMAIHQAVGTSLLVIALKSVAGLAGYLSHVQVDWALAGSFAGTAAVASLVGAALSKRVPAPKLRRGFAYFVLVMAALVLIQEL